jgi:hypothetical protein
MTYTRTKHAIVCMHCGQTEDQHCEYEAEMPEGCVCSPRDWGAYILEICPEYVGDKPTCERCEHERGCHLGATAS